MYSANARVSKLPLLFLTIISSYFLISTPQFWLAYPDSGYYLGSAIEVLNSGRYYFNTLPNLQYYPGTSSVITLGYMLFGTSIYTTQLVFSVLTLGSLYVGYLLFYQITSSKLSAFVATIGFGSSYVFIESIHPVLSDGIFVLFTFCCLLLFRVFNKHQNKSTLVLLCLAVSFCALVRFQGLFLVFAMGIALLWFLYKRTIDVKMFFITGFLLVFPFILWTLRNYILHTPDAYNMANQFFFSLSGQRLYAPGLNGDVDSSWVNASWKYAVYRPLYSISTILESYFGYIPLDYKFVFAPLFVIISISGFIKCIKKLSLLELTYIGFSTAYIAVDLLTKKHLYVLGRYWLPLLPFISLFFVMGVVWCCQKMVSSMNLITKKAHLTRVVSVALLVGFVIAGFLNTTLYYKNISIYEPINQNLDKLSAFSTNTIPLGAVVAVNDWGVIPLTLNRYAIPLLNDDSHIHSVKKMIKYSTDYMVIVEKFKRSGEPALKLAEDRPDVFQLLQIFSSTTPEANTFIFKIDKEKMPLLLDELEQAGVN
ncbi:ArnT family glycosyltransferase [Alteromonas gracilis]|uniref:ArnT family glycosyltransferase n=1 Tax=Alteromonas gracilis TaxID=1479524 RepID=UPI00321A3D67